MLAIFLFLATITGLYLFAHHFELVAPGKAADYWEYLCGIQLPSFTGHHKYAYSGGVYPEVNGSLYYFEQYHHEQRLFSVSPQDVLNTLLAVKELLQSDQPPDTRLCGDDHRSICAIYEQAASRRAVCRDNLPIQMVTLADLEYIRLKVYDRPNEYREIDDNDFRERLIRGKRIWLTFGFEATFLSAWLIFVTLPLFATTRIHWYWRVGLSPFLLFLPYFLGYAPMTFSFGPSGGFVYSIYLMLAAFAMQMVPCTVVDHYLWDLLPQLLAPLSQVPGSPAAVSYMFCIGPASALLFGLLLVAGLALIGFISSKIGGWRDSPDHIQ